MSMDEFDIAYCEAFADFICDSDTPINILALRMYGVKMLLPVIRSYQKHMLHSGLIHIVRIKKLAMIKKATTRCEIEAILQFSLPRRTYSGSAVQTSRYHVEEEELLLWALITPHTRMSHDARERYTQLFRKKFPEEAAKMGI